MNYRTDWGYPMNGNEPFEYMVMWHPTPEQRASGEWDDHVVLETRTVMARSRDQVILLAGRDIPEDYFGEEHQLEVLVRPFRGTAC